MKKRIDILDTYRAISIFIVMLYHYYTRYTIPHMAENFYPYGSKLDVFDFGFLGVNFFFIISGFVIIYSLQNTKSLVIFWKKRLIRLIPSMAICCAIILVLFNLLDQKYLFPNSHYLPNLLPSLTFSSPELWSLVFGKLGINFHYLNGSFWSLWPEIQFYFLCSFVFFYNKAKFFRNFFRISFILISIRLLSHNVLEAGKFDFLYPQSSRKVNTFLYQFWEIFNLPQYLTFFATGVLYFKLFKFGISFSKKNAILFCLLVLFLGLTQLFPYRSYFLFIFIILMINLGFILLIKNSDALNKYNLPWISKVGVASYFIYLIHENLGILLINKYGHFLGSYSILSGFILIIIFCTLGIWYTQFIENKIVDYLKKWI